MAAEFAALTAQARSMGCFDVSPAHEAAKVFMLLGSVAAGAWLLR